MNTENLFAAKQVIEDQLVKEFAERDARIAELEAQLAAQQAPPEPEPKGEGVPKDGDACWILCGDGNIIEVAYQSKWESYFRQGNIAPRNPKVEKEADPGWIALTHEAEWRAQRAKQINELSGAEEFWFIDPVQVQPYGCKDGADWQRFTLRAYPCYPTEEEAEANRHLWDWMNEPRGW